MVIFLEDRLKIPVNNQSQTCMSKYQLETSVIRCLQVFLWVHVCLMDKVWNEQIRDSTRQTLCEKHLKMMHETVWTCNLHAASLSPIPRLFKNDLISRRPSGCIPIHWKTKCKETWESLYRMCNTEDLNGEGWLVEEWRDILSYAISQGSQISNTSLW